MNPLESTTGELVFLVPISVQEASERGIHLSTAFMYPTEGYRYEKIIFGPDQDENAAESYTYRVKITKPTDSLRKKINKIATNSRYGRSGQHGQHSSSGVYINNEHIEEVITIEEAHIRFPEYFI